MLGRKLRESMKLQNYLEVEKNLGEREGVDDHLE
jgi:hypothetical protein